MNIFFLDECPNKAAEYMCDKHIPKMLLETCQMLSTAIQKYTGINKNLYKPAYEKHPMTIWVGHTRNNFSWALEHAFKIEQEYEMRFKKIHKSGRILSEIYYNGLHHSIPRVMHKDYITEPPQCMPDKYKDKDYVTGYRNYYIGAKKYFAKWQKGRSEPKWFIEKTPLNV